MSSFEVKAITTKQYEESFDTVCNALGSFLVLEELVNTGGCYSGASVTRKGEYKGYSKIVKPQIKYSFKVTKIAPKLTEVELILDIEEKYNNRKTSYNKAYYDEVDKKRRLEIERIKAINR